MYEIMVQEVVFVLQIRFNIMRLYLQYVTYAVVDHYDAMRLIYSNPKTKKLKLCVFYV